MSTLSATKISESAVITAYNDDTASHQDLNNFVTSFRTVTDAIVDDLSTLNTDKVQLTTNNTWTGTNTFNTAVSMASTLAVTGNITYAGNLVSSGTSKTIDFNTNRVQNIGSATTSTDAIQYQQAVKATGSVTENITGIKTFTTGLPICSTVPSSGSDLTNKTYVDLQVFGNSGITQATTAPAATSGALWLNTTSTSNYELFRANGTVFQAVTGIFQGTSAPTAPTPAVGRLWLDTTNSTFPTLKYYDGSSWQQVQPITCTGAITFNGALTVAANLTISGTRTLDAGANKWTNLATPTSSGDATTKGYVDTAVGTITVFDGYDNAGGQAFTGETLVNIDTIRTDLGGNWALASDIITVTNAGTYLINYHVTTTCSLVGALTALVKVNGSIVTASLVSANQDGTNQAEGTATGSFVITLSASDTIGLYADRAYANGTHTTVIRKSGINIVKL